MSNKKALGRGLRALIPVSDGPAGAAVATQVAPAAAPDSTAAGSGVREIRIESIEPNPDQPRRHFDEHALATLADSIRAHGMLQPLLVRPRPGGYELVAGERRWLAARRAGRETVPAHVREIDDDALLETALVENIQRQDLTPLEEAEAFARLVEEMGLTHQDVADRVGRDRATITNALRLLTLPPSVRELLESGKVSAGHARALLALKKPEDMTVLAHETVERGLSVRQVESRVRSVLTENQSVRAKTGSKKSGGAAQPGGDDISDSEYLTPEVRAVREVLTSKLATHVRIRRSADGHGFIEIEFYSDMDLDRLVALLVE